MTQRDLKWRHDRNGKITASRFGDILASPETKRWKNYYEEIVDQRLGVIDFAEEEDKPWFRHGRENEAAGIAAYSVHLELATQETLQVLAHPDFIDSPHIEGVGCSPDLLIHGLPKKAGGELKCVSNHAKANQYELFQKAKIPSQAIPQIHGNIWICEAMWWDFISFCPYVEEEYQLYVQRVYRDEGYISRLENACMYMNERLNNEVEFIRSQLD